MKQALAGASRFYEVPFSLLAEARIVRGTIDCVVRKEDGSLLVVELKTGRPHDSHRRQLDVYLRAVRALYGTTSEVAGELLYL